jgi:threonine-phosphate decarboxylase
LKVEQMVRPEVRSMARPRHGGDVWDHRDIKDYSSNVNPLGPPPRLNEYIAEAAEGLINYPDDTSAGLKEAIADHYSVHTNNVIVGAGSAELIRLFPEVFVSPGDKVIMPRPSFSEYDFACHLMGARLVDLPLPEEDHFRLDVGKLIAQLDGAKATYICNPNNPTSRMVRRKDVLEIVAEAHRKGTMVFLDETLLELSEHVTDNSCISEIDRFDNLFIIRSFTKSFAMPGLRIGYGFGAPEVIKYLEAGRLSWNLGTIEQRVATRLMRDEQDHIRRAVGLLSEEKERMHREVSRLFGHDVPKPESYFFFTPLNGLGVTSSTFRQVLLKQGVLVRDCSSFGGPCSAYARFCVKTRDKDDEFLGALAAGMEDIVAGRV